MTDVILFDITYFFFTEPAFIESGLGLKALWEGKKIKRAQGQVIMQYSP